MKDFLYNKSDVLIATLIIVAAACVIFWRVGVIMEMPDGVQSKTSKFVAMVLPFLDRDKDEAEATGSAETQEVAEEPPADGGTVQAPEASAETELAPATEEEAVEPPPDTAAEQPAETQPAAEAPQQTPEVVVFTVKSGDVASVIADNLLAAGLITDKQGVLAAGDAQNAAMSLKIGEFEIPKGTSNEEIIKILVG